MRNRVTRIIRTIAVTASVFVFVISIAPSAHCKPIDLTLPTFVISGKAQKMGFSKWLSIQHIGSEDKPVAEFVIGFGSTTRSTADFYDSFRRVRLVTLLHEDEEPILGFIKKPGNAGDKPGQSFGSFQVMVFSHTLAREIYFLDAKQSHRLFAHIKALLHKKAPSNRAVRTSCDQMVDFLSKVGDR